MRESRNSLPRGVMAYAGRKDAFRIVCAATHPLWSSDPADLLAYMQFGMEFVVIDDDADAVERLIATWTPHLAEMGLADIVDCRMPVAAPTAH